MCVGQAAAHVLCLVAPEMSGGPSLRCHICIPTHTFIYAYDSRTFRWTREFPQAVANPIYICVCIYTHTIYAYNYIYTYSLSLYIYDSHLSLYARVPPGSDESRGVGPLHCGVGLVLPRPVCKRGGGGKNEQALVSL